MPTININLTIAGDTVTAVSITSLLRTDTGAAPSGASLPLALTLTGGAWVGSFTDTSATTYAGTAAVTYSDGSTESVTGLTFGDATAAATSTDLLDTIADVAAGPQSVTVDGQTTVMPRLADLIEADRYRKSAAAASRTGSPYRRIQLRPGNNADLDRC